MKSKKSGGKPPQEEAEAIALRLLARREHSRAELELKLRQRGLPGEVIAPVLDDYEARGWLSDERYAEILVRQRLETGHGPLRVRADLQQKGIRETPAAFSEITEQQWCASAVGARRKRFGLENLRNDREARARQGRFLARRGFRQEQIEHALAQTDEEG